MLHKLKELFALMGHLLPTTYTKDLEVGPTNGFFSYKVAAFLTVLLSVYHRHREGTHVLPLSMKGGGWCVNEEDCLSRSKTALGSSKGYKTTFTPSYEGGNGLLGTDPSTNPDFYNWNLVYAM